MYGSVSRPLFFKILIFSFETEEYYIFLIMKFIKNVLGFGILLGGLISVFKGQEVTGFFIALSGALIIPFISKWLKIKIPKWNNKSIRYTSITCLFIFAFFFIDGSNYKPIKSISNDSKATTNKLEFEKSYWNNYSPTVKQRIKKLIDNKDCKNLQKEFKLLSKNDKAQRKRTGEGNHKLMMLIDEKMREFKCYD